MSYRPTTFSTQEKPHFRKEFLNKTIFTLFILSHTSDNTTSLNIGGTNAWAVPTSNFGGDRPPAPLGLRLCYSTTATQTMYSFTSSFQSEWRPTDSSPIHPSLSFYWCRRVYLTTVHSHLVILKSDQLTPSQVRNLGVHFDSCRL